MSGGNFIAPLSVTEAGAQPTPPATIQQQLINLVASTNPGYTATLPASLIEDLTSTMVAGLSQMNQAAVEVVNSLTPFLANPFILTQLGNLLGVPLGLGSNTSVNCVFTATAAGQPQPGVVIAQGFTVSDGTYQYIVQTGGITASNGQSPPLFCLASISGSWAVPANSVNQTATSNPPGIVITVNNPNAGTPSTGDETQGDYAARVFQAMLAASQGMDRYLKTLLANVPGVQSRLISVRQQQPSGWEIICGGGDPYEIAYAIYTALFDFSTLTGSVILINSISNAARAQYVTNLAHGLVNGEVVTIIDAAPSIYNVSGTAATATVINATAFTLNVNTAGYTASYVGSGELQPNNRNITVSILDYPDTYTIPFVTPPQQTVTMVITWGTLATNFVSSAAVSQLAAPAIAAYVNSLAVGVPMNLDVMKSTFLLSIASVIPAQNVTTIIFSVSINGIGVTPQSGTNIIAGDPESYFLTTSASISVQQN
jgi:hypothetical protein